MKHDYVEANKTKDTQLANKETVYSIQDNNFMKIHKVGLNVISLLEPFIIHWTSDTRTADLYHTHISDAVPILSCTCTIDSIHLCT